MTPHATLFAQTPVVSMTTRLIDLIWPNVMRCQTEFPRLECLIGVIAKKRED